MGPTYAGNVDKHALVQQIRQQLQTSARVALNAGEDAAAEARFGADASEKRQDARVAIEYSQLAKAQVKRARQAQAALATLESFRPKPLPARARVELGAIVEIEDEDSGEGRTLFIAPVGAGFNLTGPGGDGLLSVITPSSPMGRAVLGRRLGDVVDLTIAGDVREWAITYVG